MSEYKYQVRENHLEKQRFKDQPRKKQILGYLASTGLAVLSMILFSAPIVISMYTGDARNMMWMIASGALLWGVYRVANAQLPEWMFYH